MRHTHTRKMFTKCNVKCEKRKRKKNHLCQRLQHPYMLERKPWVLFTFRQKVIPIFHIWAVKRCHTEGKFGGGEGSRQWNKSWEQVHSRRNLGSRCRCWRHNAPTLRWCSHTYIHSDTQTPCYPSLQPPPELSIGRAKEENQGEKVGYI